MCYVSRDTYLTLLNLQFSIRATDNGNPRRSALGSVTIFITRAVLPVFRNTPYATQVQENRANATQIYTVTAVDADGRVTYNLFYILKRNNGSKAKLCNQAIYTLNKC
ncbi:hypothetical protein DPMN_036509 [Dreissena polymorpha]|uniref:Uncharacterized protein n=1 Tax=Dreissena polymorpha TaxID=45954 RepID=A0A9D4MAU2_DREPO|nr:hypothetical protein DPMN_036509 [Dreissena polymorpha]